MGTIERAKLGKWEKISYFVLMGGSVFPTVLVSNFLRGLGFGFWESAGFSLLVFAAVVYLFTRPVAAERSKRLAADLERGVFDCAIRFPNSLPGSLRDRWDPGAAQYNGVTLAFQSLNFQGDPVATPIGALKEFGRVVATAPVDQTGKRAPELRRRWKVLELTTEKGLMHLAAREEALDLLRT